MSEQKAFNRLNRRIGIEEKKRKEKFLRTETKQVKDFRFLSGLDYSIPETQVLLILLLFNVGVVNVRANMSPQPTGQPVLSGAVLPHNPLTYNNATSDTTALPGFSVQELKSSTPTPFFSHQVTTSSYGAKKFSSSPKVYSPQEGKCVIPNRDYVTDAFSLIKDILIKNPSVNSMFGNYEVIKSLLPLIPKVEDIFELYTEIKWINGGSANAIFLARGPNGEEIALRVSKSPIRRMKFFPRHIMAYATLSKIRSFSSYIPEIFAIYYAKGGNFNQLNLGNSDLFLCTEMQFIQKDYHTLYYTNGENKEMEPKTIFEEVLGMYLVQIVARCSIDDADGDVTRHHVYSDSKKFVCYRIGSELYLFSPGISPHKIDYDDFASFGGDSSEDEPFKISSYSFLFDHASEEMKTFLHDINEKGLFQSVKLHFSKFLVSEQELKNYPNVVYFDLTELAQNELQKYKSDQLEVNHGLRI